MCSQRWPLTLVLLFVFVAAGAVLPWAGESDESALIQRIRQQLRIPPNYSVKLGPPEKTGIPCVTKRTLEVSGGAKPRTETIYLSEDGRYLFWGRLYDLEAQPEPNRFKSIPLDGHPMRGAVQAPVTVIEYGDFQCPFCERTYWTLKYKLLRRYPGQVRLIYKDFPLSQIHPWALKAAVGAQCAFAQGNDAFWKMHDLLFENQDEITPDNIAAKLAEFAAASGIDVAEFQHCYESEASLARVKASVAEAESLGLTGTPAFVVNGQLLSGAVSFPAFKSIIERELAAQSAPR